MVLAVEAGHRNSKKEVAKFMIYTILGGLAFLSCQAWEWYTFIHEGARLDSNTFGITKQGYDHLHSVSFGSHFEWEVGDRTFGPVPFAALFFIVTGFHGFHVFNVAFTKGNTLANSAVGRISAGKYCNKVTNPITAIVMITTKRKNPLSLIQVVFSVFI